MTMPHERSRSIIQTGDFLRELLADQSLPESVRQGAKSLLRHYPEPWVILSLGRFEEQLKTLDPADPQRESAIQLHQTMLSSSTER